MGKRKQKKLKRTPEEQALRNEKLRLRQKAAAERRRKKKAKAEGYRWETFFIRGKMKHRRVYLWEDERAKFPFGGHWGKMGDDCSTKLDQRPAVAEDPPEAFPTVPWWN